MLPAPASQQHQERKSEQQADSWASTRCEMQPAHSGSSTATPSPPPFETVKMTPPTALEPFKRRDKQKARRRTSRQEVPNPSAAPNQARLVEAGARSLTDSFQQFSISDKDRLNPPAFKQPEISPYCGRPELSKESRSVKQAFTSPSGPANGTLGGDNPSPLQVPDVSGPNAPRYRSGKIHRDYNRHGYSSNQPSSLRNEWIW